MRRLLVPLFAASLSPLAVGQTVWRAADGPRTITGTYTVPAGTSLTIEAGVTVRISSNSRLVVNGTLNANGSPTAPVKFIGADNYSALLTVAGTLDMKYGDVGAQTQTMDGGSLLFTDTKFTGWGQLGNSPDYFIFNRTPYVGLSRCSFVGSQANLYISEVILNIRDTSFTSGAWGNVSYGYVILDNVRSDSAPNTGLYFGTDHSLYVNHVTVTNAGGPGLELGAGNWGTNHFIGPDNTLAGNKYPLAGGGFLPGSTVPATGNVNNRVLFGPTGDFRGGMTLAPLAVPYEVNGVPTNYGGTLTMLPGTRFKMAPNSQFRIDVGGFRVRGRKGNPVVFERLDPTQAWTQIHFNHHNEFLSNLIVDGSLYGVNGGDTYIDNALFRNNGTASMGGATSQWSTFDRNGVAYEGDRPQAPGNSFLNNTIAIRAPGSTVDARNNWWGSSAGPAAGQLQGSVLYQPFLTAPPSTNDAPYITLNRIEEGLRPGDKFTISWKSEDDAGVVSHRILFSPAGNWPTFFTPVTTVPGSQQAYEWTVPDIGPQGLTDPGYLRVVAVDAQGRERYDEVAIRINAAYVTGEVTFTTPLAGRVFRSGDRMSLAWTHTLNSNYGVETFIFADGYGMFPMGGGFANYGVWDHIKMPQISTNRARIGMRVGEGPNRYKWFFTPYFSIRPDARIGDAPPVITASATSSVIAPGSPVTLTWTASDDEAVRSFELHASFDAGRTWHEIQEDIPASATSTTWIAAPGTGYPNALFRVVAIDQRFQRTASADIPVRIGSGTVVAPSLSGFTLNAASIVGGTTLQGTVTLSAAAPTGGATVTLASSNTVAAVPGSVTVAAGSTTATFGISTQAVAANTAVSLTAGYGGITKSAALSVTPAALGGVTLSPSTVTGGASSTGTVTLTGAAPTGGMVVSLSSGNAVVTVPVSVTVAAGAKTATFTASTKAVSAATNVPLTATQGGVSRSATLTLNPAAVTDSVSVQRAEYESSKRTIRVDATSTSSTATLKVFVTSTGALIGTLSNNGGGRYSGTLSIAVNPGSITVKSSLGGSGTRTVSAK